MPSSHSQHGYEPFALSGGVEMLVERNELSLWRGATPLERCGKLHRVGGAERMQSKHAKRLVTDRVAGLPLEPARPQ